MEIIRVADGDYNQYEELLLQKEQLEKDAEHYSNEYTRIFGDLMLESLELKVDCISIKKSISYCILVKNKGLVYDTNNLDEYLKKHMSAYVDQIQKMNILNNAAKSAKPISPFVVSEIKIIYRRIAKLLHPDISPLIVDYPILNDLFQRAIIAYHCNNLNEIRDLEVLINKALKNLGIERVNVEIPNIKKRISDLEFEINSILTNAPYTYKSLLNDAFKINEKKEELQTDINNYKEYKMKLQKQLDEILGELQNGK